MKADKGEGQGAAYLVQTGSPPGQTGLHYAQQRRGS